MRVITTVVMLSLISTVALAQNAVIDVTLNPMGDFKGKTSDVKGFAVVKGDEVTAENIVVNLKNLKTGVELRDKHTQKHLDTANHPDAVLVSAKGKGGKGTGKIRIRGIEKDIAGTYKIEGKKLEAQFKLNIADFGISDINYMGVGVEDEITVNVTVPVKAN